MQIIIGTVQVLSDSGNKRRNSSKTFKGYFMDRGVQCSIMDLQITCSHFYQIGTIQVLSDSGNKRRNSSKTFKGYFMDRGVQCSIMDLKITCSFLPNWDHSGLIR
jgi:hypothetical protein